MSEPSIAWNTGDRAIRINLCTLNKKKLSLSIWVVFLSRMHYQDQLVHPEREKSLSLSNWYHIWHVRNAHYTVKHPFLVVSSSRIHTLIHSPDLLVLAADGEVAAGLVLHDPGQCGQGGQDSIDLYNHQRYFQCFHQSYLTLILYLIPGQVTQQRLDTAHYHLKQWTQFTERKYLFKEKTLFSQQCLRACDFTMLLLECHSTERTGLSDNWLFHWHCQEAGFWDRESVLTELELVDKRRWGQLCGSFRLLRSCGPLSPPLCVRPT